MTLNDIARLAGVSKATASRAFSNPSAVSESTRNRVLEIARLHNFRPNSMAQAVASRKSGLVGFCLYNKEQPFFGHTFFGPILDGVTERAKELDYHVVLAITDQMQDPFEERFIEDAIEGAILSTFMPEKMVEAFRKRNTPVVLINDELTVEHTGYILDDNYGGAKKLMAHLIDECGYRSIAFVSNRLSHSSNMLRYIGYIDALEERGIQPYSAPGLPYYDLFTTFPPQERKESSHYGYSPGIMNQELYSSLREYNHTMLGRYGYSEIPRRGTPVIFSGNSPQDAYENVQALLDQPELPRAIFCVSDSLAVGVVKAIKARGLRIPEDIAVCGYDDVESAYLSEPPITTISVDRAGIGHAAVDLLKSYIDQPNQPRKAIYMSNKLIVRESTMRVK